MTYYPGREHEDADAATRHIALNALDGIVTQATALHQALESGEDAAPAESQSIGGLVVILTAQLAILSTLRKVRQWETADLEAGNRQFKQLPERIRSKLKINIDTGCWVWTGKLNDSGYGVINWEGHPGVRVHRLAYALIIGPIPGDLEIDHVHAKGCRSRACCFPGHLEPVVHAENMRRYSERITHCPAGHPYDETNTSITPAGKRHCRACDRESHRRRYAEVAASEGRAVQDPRSERSACKRGHEFTPENTYVSPAGNRACRTCRQADSAERYARKRGRVEDQ